MNPTTTPPPAPLTQCGSNGPSIPYDPRADGCSDLPRDFTPPRPLPSLDPPETTGGSLNEQSSFSPTPESLALEYSWRHSFWSVRRSQTHEALMAADVPAGTLRRFLDCGHNSWVYQSDADPTRYRVHTDKCHSRWCEACQVEHRRTVSRNLCSRLVSELGLSGPRTSTDKLRFITLTVKSSTSSLQIQLDKLYNDFKTLRGRALWRKRVNGGILFLELTLSPRGAWHPHLHILAYGKYLPQSELADAWKEITGDSFIVDVRLVRNPVIAASYVAKYASKVTPASLVHDRAHFVEAITALAGRRTFTPFGNWVGWHLSQPPPDDSSWHPIAPLADILTRAQAGDVDARRIVLSLRHEESHENTEPQATGPPEDEMSDLCGEDNP